jgi:hypothetical protein
MGEEDARRYLHGQPNRFRPFPPGAGRGGRAVERLYRLFVDNGWCPYRALQLCRSYDYLILNGTEGHHVLTFGTWVKLYSRLFDLSFVSDKIILIDLWCTAEAQA